MASNTISSPGTPACVPLVLTSPVSTKLICPTVYMTSSLGYLIQTPHGQTPQPFTKSYRLYARNLFFPVSGNGPNFYPTQKEKNHPRSFFLPQTLYLQHQAKRCPLLRPPLSISMATALIQDPITSELSWNLLTTFPPPSLLRGHDQLPPVIYVSAHVTFSPDFK